MSALKLFLTVIVHVITSNAFTKSITLNNMHVGTSGIGVIITATHVNITNNTWHIDPKTQDGTDLEVQMNNEWGFHPSIPSTISLTIHGHTPNITKTDGEFLILFGVGTSYFSVVIRLERGTAWKTYPDWKSSPLAVTNDIYVDLIAKSTVNRWNRLSNNDQWSNIGHPDQYKIGLEWPLKISITNDPNEDTVHYECILPERTLFADYNTSFLSNTGLSVYIMNDASDGKPFDIYSIDVQYNYMTISPTYSPSTLSPTVSTITPSQSPITKYPTNIPSTPSPVLSIGEGMDSQKPTKNEKEVQMDTTIYILSKEQDVWSDDNIKVKEHDDMLYVVVIVILSILLCVIIMILVIKHFRKNKSEKNEIKTENVNGAPLNSPNYHQKQLTESIVNQNGIIPGNEDMNDYSLDKEDDGADDDNDDDSLYDSDEEMFEKPKIITNTLTETGTLMTIKCDNFDDDIKNEDENDEGTPETMPVEIKAISM